MGGDGGGDEHVRADVANNEQIAALLGTPDPRSRNVRTVCQSRRQAFVDCMYETHGCVRSGRLSFADCLREALNVEVDRETGAVTRGEPMSKACYKKYVAYLRCRQQMADPRSNLRGFR